MIKAREINIGNWVNGSHNGFSKDVVIYDFDRNSIQHTDETNNPLPLSSFKPIELTEGWLKKAGFNKMPGNTFQNINLPYWCKESVLLFFNTGQEEYSFKIGYGEIVEGKYFAATFRWINKLHILQNIFYDITSKELTIKL